MGEAVVPMTQPVPDGDGTAPATTWFAPGKLFWLGEYVVLTGSPAVVSAVDRGAVVEARPSEAAGIRVWSGLWEGPVVIADARGYRWPSTAPEGAALLGAVVAEVMATPGYGRDPGAGLVLRIDTAQMHADSKLGIGSSGAVAAGLARALAAATVPPEAIAALALRAHDRFQGGTGSGADVLASLWGGVFELTAGRQVSPIVVPASLRVAVAFTGTSADTRVFVRGVRSWAAGAPAEAERRWSEGRAATEAGIASLRAGDVAGWLDAVSRFLAFEEGLGSASGVGIVNTPVSRIVAACGRAGWTAKPSGAGGGDVVVAFAGPGGDAEWLAREVMSSGGRVIALATAPRGVLEPAGIAAG